LVKARIIAAGLEMGDVARKAGKKRSTFSDYLAGRSRNIHGQILFVEAFNALTGQHLSVRDFWGDLTGEIAA
jgi:hypothetical protein